MPFVRRQSCTKYGRLHPQTLCVVEAGRMNNKKSIGARTNNTTTHDTSLVPRLLANVNGERQRPSLTPPTSMEVRKLTVKRKRISMKRRTSKRCSGLQGQVLFAVSNNFRRQEASQREEHFTKNPKGKACRGRKQKPQETRTMLTKLQRRLKFWQIIHSLVSKTCF